MKTTILLLISIILFANCTYKVKSKNDDESSINDLIIKNQEKTLFLNFWEGISDNDFNRLIKYENNQGNLRDNKFILVVPNYDLTIDVPFSISKTDNSVELIYTDDLWIREKDIDVIRDGFYVKETKAKERGQYYSKIEKYLVDTYDEKYERLDPEIYMWKTNSKNGKSLVITFRPNYWYYALNTRTRNMYGLELLKNGEKAYLEKDEKRNRDKVAHCDFTVEYITYETYLEREAQHLENARKYKNEEIQKQQEMGNNIKNNKEKL